LLLKSCAQALHQLCHSHLPSRRCCCSFALSLLLLLLLLPRNPPHSLPALFAISRSSSS
jgi:hypothetical protein